MKLVVVLLNANLTMLIAAMLVARLAPEVLVELSVHLDQELLEPNYFRCHRFVDISLRSDTITMEEF